VRGEENREWTQIDANNKSGEEELEDERGDRLGRPLFVVY
jgi:hypothetical protein